MGKDYNKVKHFVFICNGKDCKKSGAKDLERAISSDLKSKGLRDKTKILKTKCTGRCKEAPIVLVNNHWLADVKMKDVPDVVEILIK